MDYKNPFFLTVLDKGYNSQQAVIENAKILLADGKYTASEISKLLHIPIESFTVSE